MRRALLLVGVLLLAACGGEELPEQAESSATESVSPSPSESAPDSDPQSEPLTVLLVGLDEDTGSQRADVILLTRADAEREHASIMSIHRDTWVTIPGHGEGKVNAAYAFGGDELLADTVRSIYSTTVDHTVTLDFDAFVAVSEILGPITVDTADGPVELVGGEALDFVRERAALPGGDFDRVRRQQAYLAGVADALRSAGPGQRAEVMRAVAEHVTVDGSRGAAAHLLLLDLLARVEGSETTFFSSPHGGTGWSHDGQSIVLPGDIDSLADAYEGDTLDEWLETVGAETLDSRPVE